MTDAEDYGALRDANRARIELEQVARHMNGLKTAALEELISTSADQTAKRERLIVCAQIIEALKLSLMATAAQGDVANYRIALAEQNLFRP